MEWIYKRNQTNSARFVLGEYNSFADTTLICVGINPSTAEPDKLDNTLRRVKAIAAEHGYVNWVMINIYPQRATESDDLHAQCDMQLHSDNLTEIKNLLTSFCNADILLAYGNLIDKRPYLKNCFGDIMQLVGPRFAGKLYCIRRTKNGNPVHPLYQKTTAPFTEF